MMGTSPHAKGGIATVVSNYQVLGLLHKWGVHYIVTHVQHSKMEKLRVALSAFLELFGMLLQGRVALLHVHITSGASTWRKLIYVYAAMLFKVPTFIHIHSGDYFHFFENKCNALKKSIIRCAFQHAAVIIALSTSWVPGVRRIAPNVDLAVLGNAVPLHEAHQQLSSLSASNHNSVPMILFLGYLGASKGVFDLIHAAELISCNFRLVIAGDGDLDAGRRLANELGMEKKIEFVGWVDGKDKELLLCSAQILVLPSYTEGIPMSILEAMSRSIPIVATPVGGVPEVLTDGQEGILVPVGNIRQLAIAIEKLLSNPELSRRMGAAGRKRIQDTYSAEMVYPQLESLWMAAGVRPPAD